MEGRITLVTGATGRLGAALLDRLLARGVPCRALVRDPGVAALPSGVEIVTGNLADPCSLTRAVAGAGDVLHLAALTDDGPRSDAGLARRLREVNVDGTQRLAEAAARAGVARFLFVSSATVFGSRPEGLVDDASLPDPDTAYGCSKLEAEERALRVGQEAGMRVTVVRPALVACPPSARRDPLAVLLRLARRGLLPVPRGAGPCRKSILGLDDAVAGLLAVHARARPGQRYLLAGPRGFALAEIAACFARALGRRAALPVPAALLRGAGWTAEAVGGAAGRSLPVDRIRVAKYLADEQFSGTRMREELGFSHETTELEDILRPCLGAGLVGSGTACP